MKRSSTVSVILGLAALVTQGCDGSGGGALAVAPAGTAETSAPIMTTQAVQTVEGPPSGPLKPSFTLSHVCRPDELKPRELHLNGTGLDGADLRFEARVDGRSYPVEVLERAPTELLVRIGDTPSDVIDLRLSTDVVFDGLRVDLAAVSPCVAVVPRRFPLLFTAGNGGALCKADAEGAVTPFVAGLGATTDFGGPAFDGQGNLYVPAAQSNSILKVTRAGVVTVFVTDALLANPQMCAFGRAGDLYVTAYTGHRVVKVSRAGVVTPFITTGLSSPTGITFDAEGNLYVASYTGNRVNSFDAEGALRTGWGFAGRVSCHSPAGLAFDSHGDLFVASHRVHRVSRIRAGESSALFFASTISPAGLAIDGDDNLYVGSYSGQIYKVTPDRVVTTLVTGQSSVRALTLSP